MLERQNGLMEKELRIEREELKNLEQKLAIKKEIFLAKDIDISSRTENALNKIFELKKEEKNLDRDFEIMELRFKELEPKIGGRRQRYLKMKKKMEDEEERKRKEALEIVKNSVRIYGKKNIDKILKGEVSK